MASITDPLDFTGQVVVVTGGTRNIGRAISDRFAAAGATVVAIGRTDPGDLGPLHFLACDVRDLDALAAAINRVAADHGRLDVLVNNAGGSPPAPASEASARFNERIVTLNLLAPMQASQAANRIMQAQGGGVIVNIGSVSGMRPTPDTAAYGAAKAGLANLTQTLAMEWAPKVRVNMVTAGLVLTDDTAQWYGDGDTLARVNATVPLGRIAVPEEIADAVLAMASPLFRHASGANVVVAGGGERPPYLAAKDPP